MEDRLAAIERKLEEVAALTQATATAVKDLAPREVFKYTEDLKAVFLSIEERMRLRLKMVQSMTGSDIDKQCYSTSAAGARLGLSRYTLSEKCRKGTIRAIKVDGAGAKGEWSITHEELLRYEREGDLSPPEPPEPQRARH